MQISNKEYEKALNNKDNQTIMEIASFPFKYSIEKDELYRCKLIALWATIKSWKPNHGAKFTSFLYQKVKWECLKSITANKKYINLPITIEPSAKTDIDIDDILYILPPDLYDIMHKRFIYNMTLQEIAKIKKCCHETVRKKIKKALKLIKDHNIVENGV